MTNSTTNTPIFAEVVQSAMRLGINLATEAFEKRDIGFFEAAIAEQGRLVELAKHNVANRPSFDEWTASALKIDSESFIHAYDITGEITRLNEILFGEHGREYYEQYVLPAFDTTPEALDAHYKIQVAALTSLVEILKNEVITQDDDNAMSDIGQHLNKVLDEATPDELVAVLKKK